MNKVIYIALLALCLPAFAWSQVSIGPTQRVSWTYNIEGVDKSDIETVTTRVGDILYQRLRLSDSKDFSLSSGPGPKITILWKRYQSTYSGLKRLISAPILMGLHASPEDTVADEKLELEARRRAGDYIFPCQPTSRSSTKVTYRLAEKSPLFGTPHMKWVEIEHAEGKAHIIIHLTPLGMRRLKDHWAKWIDKKLVVVMARRIHGLPLQFGPIIDGKLKSKAIDGDVALIMKRLMLAGCNLPRLTFQQP